jgi:hypothetical protein
MDARQTALRVNVSVGLVFLSLIAELFFVVIVGYGAYRVIEFLR